MTHKERQEASQALMRWFQSQSINPAHAAIICGMVTATIIAELADDDADLEHGLKDFTNSVTVLTRSCYQALP